MDPLNSLDSPNAWQAGAVLFASRLARVENARSRNSMPKVVEAAVLRNKVESSESFKRLEMARRAPMIDRLLARLRVIDWHMVSL